MALVVAAQIEVPMLLSCSESFGAHSILLARAVGFGSGSWKFWCSDGWLRFMVHGIVGMKQQEFQATVLSRLHRHETEFEMREPDQASS